MIQDSCEALGESGCNIFAFYFCLGLDPREAVSDYDSLVKGKYILPDCTIVDYSGLAKYKGKLVTVKWTDKDAYDIGIPYIGRWGRKDSSGRKVHHFVAMKNGEIIFNSLSKSKCVNEGVLEDIRKIEWLS